MKYQSSIIFTAFLLFLFLAFSLLPASLDAEKADTVKADTAELQTKDKTSEDTSEKAAEKAEESAGELIYGPAYPEFKYMGRQKCRHIFISSAIRHGSNIYLAGSSLSSAKNGKNEDRSFYRYSLIWQISEVDLHMKRFFFGRKAEHFSSIVVKNGFLYMLYSRLNEGIESTGIARYGLYSGRHTYWELSGSRLAPLGIHFGKRSWEGITACLFDTRSGDRVYYGSIFIEGKSRPVKSSTCSECGDECTAKGMRPAYSGDIVPDDGRFYWKVEGNAIEGSKISYSLDGAAWQDLQVCTGE